MVRATSEVKAETKAAVIAAYRRSLERRYQIASVRAIPQLAEHGALLSDELIARVRDFFLLHLYPPAETRQVLDDAFDRMKDVMTSPRRMFALLGTAGRSLFRLGSMIPSAISAGLHTLEAVAEIRKLEGTLAARAERDGIAPGRIGEDPVFAELVRSLPEKEVVRFRAEMNKLFRHLSNIRLLEATIDILRDSRDRMQERGDLFTEAELSGISLGIDVMEAGVALYREVSPEQIDALHAGVNLIEEHWYDQMVGRVAPAT